MLRRSGQGFRRYLGRDPKARLVISINARYQKTYQVGETGVFLVESHGCGGGEERQQWNRFGEL